MRPAAPARRCSTRRARNAAYGRARRVVLRVGARVPDGGPARRARRGLAGRRAAGRRAPPRRRARPGRLLRRQGRARGTARDRSGSPFAVEPGERPFLHPGRAASVLVGDDEQKLGWIGELHPLVARAWDLPGGAAFELDADALAEIPGEPRRATGRCPRSRPSMQDIAVVVDEDVPAADVEAAVRAARRRAARAAAAVRRVPRRAGRRGEQVARAAARVPRARPHADRRRGRRRARADRERARRDRGEAPWLASPSSGHPGSRARCARRSSSATRGSSSTWSPRAATRAACSPTSTRATASTASSRPSMPIASPRPATPRSSPTRTARPRRRSRSCARAG